jgi:hypothetical protein
MLQTMHSRGRNQELQLLYQPASQTNTQPCVGLQTCGPHSVERRKTKAAPPVAGGREVAQQQAPAVGAQRRGAPAPRRLPERVQVHLQGLGVRIEMLRGGHLLHVASRSVSRSTCGARPSQVQSHVYPGHLAVHHEAVRPDWQAARNGMQQCWLLGRQVLRDAPCCARPGCLEHVRSQCLGSSMCVPM